MVCMTSIRPSSRVAGLLLAAGAGQRMGRPKALMRHADGRSWVATAVRVLVDGGCSGVLVVIGAQGEEVEAELATVTPPPAARIDAVRAHDWQAGMGASLRTGLAAVASTGARAALVHLVDTPDVGADVVARLLAACSDQDGGDQDGGDQDGGDQDGGDQDGANDHVLARAGYQGVPGHPVLIGRAHWAGVADAAVGDVGARAYLARRQVRLVECGDLATGCDLDSPEDLPASCGDGTSV